MKRLAAILFCLILPVAQLLAQKAQYVPNTVIVKYKNEKAAQNRDSEFEYLCKTHIRKNTRMFSVRKTDSPSAELSRIFRIEYEGSADPVEMARKLAQSESVEYAQPYWIPELLEAPDDPALSTQYLMELTHALEAYDITHGDTNIVIGIVDTGVDIYHADLADNIKINYADPINGIDDDMDGYVDNYRGWDLACNDNNPVSSVIHHGTAVAGIAAATTNNGIGIAGVGYNTKFLPIKVADDETGALIACYEGVVYAADHGCQIINCSWGSPGESLLCNDVIKYAQSRGCLIISAAGNSGINERYYPASVDGVISVAATNDSDVKWSNSTYNSRVDMSAPGQRLNTTWYGDRYQWANGTSFAAPVVAGAAALVWAVRKDLTATQIGELLRVTADNIDTIPENIPYAGMLGSGRINILKALTDNTSPSLRITGSKFTAEGGVFLPGAYFTVGIDVRNYLQPAHNVTIRLESPDGSATIGNGVWQTDSIGSMCDISNIQFTATLSDTISENRDLVLRIRFEADGYSASQEVEVAVNPTYKDIEWGEMQTTIADNGKIGIYDYQKGKGLIYQNCYNLVSDGALILALDKSKIISSFQTDNEFKPVNKPEITTEGGVSHIRSSIQPHDLRGITVEQDFIFDGRNLPTGFICDYKIINTRKEEFDNACAGLYFDWDIVYSLTNCADYDPEHKMVYIFNTGNIGLYGGICLLDSRNAVPYVFEAGNQYSNSINLEDGFNNEQKWEAMNHARTSSTGSGNDLALMLSCNNLKIQSNDTVCLKFAVLAGENLYELKKAADKAIELYRTDKPNVSIDDAAASWLNVYPTVVESALYVESASNIASISIYSTSGTLEMQTACSGNSATIDAGKLKSGIHIVVVTDDNGRNVHKMVVKR